MCARLFARRQRSELLKLLEQDLEGCHLRVQAQHLFGGGTPLQYLVRDLLEPLGGHVVSEVELGQVLPDDGEAAFPRLGRLPRDTG